MVKCLSRVELISVNPHALAAFYQSALGFTKSAPAAGRQSKSSTSGCDWESRKSRW